MCISLSHLVLFEDPLETPESLAISKRRKRLRVKNYVDNFSLWAFFFFSIWLGSIILCIEVYKKKLFVFPKKWLNSAGNKQKKGGSFLKKNKNFFYFFAKDIFSNFFWKIHFFSKSNFLVSRGGIQLFGIFGYLNVKFFFSKVNFKDWSRFLKWENVWAIWTKKSHYWGIRNNFPLSQLRFRIQKDTPTT